MSLWVLTLSLLLLCASSLAAEMILIEAEGFQERGGWVVDQQFMDQMGSPFLLAHGLGEPVADASTTAKVAVSCASGKVPCVGLRSSADVQLPLRDYALVGFLSGQACA